MRRHTRWLGVAAVVGTLLAAPSLMPAAMAATVNISGEVGETIDPDATFGGYMLRYVGDPAPDGYSHDYQWVNPYIETQPEDGPVVFDGTLDFTNRQIGDTSMIGLLDKAALEAGEWEFQQGAYIYATVRPNGDVRLGVSDGNVGGELVQAFRTIPAATADAGPIAVTFTVDGTADPATCAAPADVSTADGCMTLEIAGFAPVTDSYGSVPGRDEFATGAVPGWEAYPQGPTGVLFDFTIDPVTSNPQNKDQCKGDGWQSYGFANQGQCIRYVNTGQDSR